MKINRKRRRRKKRRATAAEVLLDYARVTRLPRDELLVFDEAYHPDEVDFARVKLALDFERRGVAFALRAIVEKWDILRIVREVY